MTGAVGANDSQSVGGTKLSSAVGSVEGIVAVHRDLARLEKWRGEIHCEIQPGPAAALRQFQVSVRIG